MLRTTINRGAPSRPAARSWRRLPREAASSSSTSISSASSARLPGQPPEFLATSRHYAVWAPSRTVLYAKRQKGDDKAAVAAAQAPDAEDLAGEETVNAEREEAHLRKELASIGLADSADQIVKRAQEIFAQEDASQTAAAAAPVPVDEFEKILLEIADLRQKGLLRDHDILSTYDRYQYKQKTVRGLRRRVLAQLEKMDPRHREFLSRFVELVPPVEEAAEEEQAGAAQKGKSAAEGAKGEAEEQDISFLFAPPPPATAAQAPAAGKKAVASAPSVVHVGKPLRFTPQDQKQYLPEGVSGQLKNTQFKFGDDAAILRKVTYDLIQELKRRQENGFLASAGNDSVILNGEGGSGKSTVLSQLVLWARKNDWFVVWIPDGRQWASSDIITPSALEHAHYDQIEKAARFAARLSITHGDKLKAIKLKGDYELDGFHRRSDSTLFDLLEFAYKNDKRAVDTLFHFRRELNRVTEFPTLIAVDRYNYLWDYTTYLDPADVNRGNFRRLWAQKLMLTKMFSNHQDHGLVNGTMVCALETTKPATLKHYLRECGDKHLYEVPPYTMNEFHEIMQHYKDIKYISIDDNTKATEKFIYQLCNGLPGPIYKYCSMQ